MNEGSQKKPTTVLMGRQEMAKYKEQKVDIYKYNPLIEALPYIYTQKQVINFLTSKPNYNAEDINESPEIRLHLIQQIKHTFVQPLPIHLDLQSKVSLMLRSGYQGRNPVSPLYARQFVVGIHNIFKGDYDEKKGNIIGNRSTASSFALIGISGIGKSTAIEKILLLYPQVIIHSEYEHNGLSIGYLNQIVWLVIECPFNGSRGTLCKNFFEAVDSILGTSYYQKYVKQRVNESDLIDKMAHVAALHCIGVLVFDEVQRMQKGQEGQQTMNFFVEIHNKLGVPLIFVGTYKAIDLFTPLLANARRASAMGAEFFDRMDKDKKWDYFLEQLWKYQWLREPVPLTEEMNELFYKETLGITDLVVNLFIQAQYLTISLGKEKLTLNLVKKAAKKNLKLLQPMLTALKTGDKEKLKRIDDLKPEWIDINAFLKALPTEVHIEGAISKEHKKAIIDAKEFVQYVGFAQSLGLTKKEAIDLVSQILDQEEVSSDSSIVNKKIAKKILTIPSDDSKKNSREKKGRKKVIDDNYLHVIGLKALEEKKSLVEELQKINVIAPFNEFLS
ncbi:ATP-binding protein [Neobacillus sp. OS1-2]|uniref:ATP-binding protein n=1 Tax=Neobacillus sp. OS1-2 TaxID=3070680 RepID=UPI0027DFF07F|nr:ATP-binding protein [Neobacillus sp. OS1-2]WML42280.1 ATP-binding protein [Neobacillus sp. OS1-2]